MHKTCCPHLQVLDYLSVAEVIETMEDLVQFVRDLSPCLSKVTREVEKRVEDLTHQVRIPVLSPLDKSVKLHIFFQKPVLWFLNCTYLLP